MKRVLGTWFYYCFTKSLPLHPQELGGLVNNGLLLGEGHVLQSDGVRSGDLSTSDTDSGGSEVVKAVLHSQSHDLGGNTEHGVTGLDNHQAASFLNGGDDALNVQRLDGTQVEHLGVNTVLLLQFGGGGEGLTDTARDGDDGQVLSGTLDLSLTDRQNEVALLGGLAHGESLTVHKPIRLEIRLDSALDSVFGSGEELQ